jgi:cellulose synthase/poly-beta-1,6-N-acetylglucosamine synthase-like glycosyltransferase
LKDQVPALQDYVRDPGALSCPMGGRSSLRWAAAQPRGLLTIITVAFNSATTLERTIDSVGRQTYPNIEYIVVDGGSTDGTLDLLRQRDRDIDLWLSEPDGGISDAFNKGIALGRGEFIALLNSDDWIEHAWSKAKPSSFSETS